jgi:hypothetical protein
MFPTPTPPPRAATLMPPGLSNPGAIPGAMTPKPPGAVTLSTSQRIGAGTPTPPPKTIAHWGSSPNPQPRVPTGATLPGSPESNAAATVRASMAMSKSHPVVIDNGLDFEPAPAAARSKKGIVIVVVAAVAAAGVGFFVLGGGSKEPTVTPAPVAAPRAAAPAPAPAVAPAAPVEAAKPVAAPPPPAAAKPVAPPEVKPAAPPAELPEATASTRHDSKGKGKSKSHREAKSSPAAKPAAAKPAAGKPAAAGVPVID